MTVTTVPRPSRHPSEAATRTAAPRIVGREAELARVEALVRTLDAGARSLVLVGEAGIGKTTLWTHAVERCRSAGARVLVTRPAEEDRHSAGQGLRDLLDGVELPDDVPTAHLLADDLPALDRSRATLDTLRALAVHGPVVVAVDDLPWLDDVTWRALRFSLRRLADARVSLLATARTWAPDTLTTAVPDVGPGVDLLPVGALSSADLRRLVAAALPGTSAPVALRAGDLAHGNPFFALELARTSGDPSARVPQESTPLAALAGRVHRLPPATLRLARLLAAAGPSPVPFLAAVGRLTDVEHAVRPGLESDTFTIGPDFVLRFTHPLIATAVLAATNAFDARELRRSLADAVTDPDTRAVHLARAVVAPDPAVAEELDQAAARVARRGAPQLAADLLADAARVTPPADVEPRVRRTLARMMQCATAGDLPAALRLASALLDELGPGPLRAHVLTSRVVLDFTDAETFLRTALDDVPADGLPDHELLRGRVLGLLGWLLGIHLGRPADGLRHASEALALGRAHHDTVLVAQAASAVATTSLLLGRRADDLVAESVRLGDEVVQSQLALWPRVLQGRHELWDGHLTAARTNHEVMYRRAVANGAEFQRSYRLTDLALVALAQGDLDRAAQHAADGLEAADDCGDERAVAWLAYPAGLVAALRGDEAAAAWSADRLEHWAAHVGERPRTAMAAHVRGTLAAARQDWGAALDHLLRALAVLDDLGIAHPGTVPVLPLAVHAATLVGATGTVEQLAERLGHQAAHLGAPWADAQAAAARGQLLLLRDDPDAHPTLTAARQAADALGYRLDAARIGTFEVAAALRAGRRLAVRQVADETLDVFRTQGVLGWEDLATDLRDRVRGGPDDALTATEQEVAGLVSTGLRNREVARRLFVSESTVEAHLTRVYRKLGVRNRAELVRRLGPG
ncbi:LuxR family transcriptional regulator [Cellulomonas sp.]|uniref:helix-turn-helix transcriptional regulator n=1 Tax=Cellulomonas sp. TaxID=40001 RepID=UPI001B00A7FC|nr:LuxR family transcriptional regulator [Cellulomonas sp.]MBO9554423.1 AAA family ATPase [Cellulomonas sp.]